MMTKVDGKSTPKSARRIAYKIVHGVEPEAERLKVTCGNSLCVNPEHFYHRPSVLYPVGNDGVT